MFVFRGLLGFNKVTQTKKYGSPYIYPLWPIKALDKYDLGPIINPYGLDMEPTKSPSSTHLG